MTRSEAELGPKKTDTAKREGRFVPASEMSKQQRKAMQNEVEARWPKVSRWPS